MGLIPSNYSLLDQPNMNWLRTNMPSSPLTQSGTSIAGGPAKGFLAGMPLGPIGMGAGALIGATGEGISGAQEGARLQEEKERLKREEEFRKKQANIAQLRNEAAAGRQGINLLSGIRSGANANRNRSLLARDIALLRK